MFLLNLLVAASGTVAGYQERPNIIVFLVDDMGLMDTSVPFLTDGSGNRVRHSLNNWYHTPNMERMAEQGICFSTLYAQSVSSPSRASLLTGQNATRHRTTNWINAESNNRTPFGPPDWNWKGLTKDIPTMPKVLQQAGYKTIHIGKAHFGCMDSEGENPLNLGFDVNIAGSGIGHPGSYYGEWGYGHIKGSKARAVPDLEKYHGTDTFLTEALTLEAKGLMDKALAKEKPFFLYMSHYAVHAPFATDKRFYDRYIAKGLSHKEAQYAGLVEGMDKSLGDLMDYLEVKGIAQNTVIIFMSDNGGYTIGRTNKNYPLSEGKGSLKEGGIREPMIVCWPGVTQPATVNVTPVIIEDFFPSILELAGMKGRIHTPQIIDGRSFVAQLKGKQGDQKRPLYFHYPNNWGERYETTGAPQSAVIEGDWKLIYYYESQTSALFNLKEDISEQQNLIGEKAYQKIALKLAKDLTRHLKKTNATMPVVKVTGDFVKYPDGSGVE